MTGWPRTARPVAFDMVFDLVMPRLFGDVTPVIRYKIHQNTYNLKIRKNLPELLGVLVEAAVAVAGLEPLYRGVFSLMVAVSTVF